MDIKKIEGYLDIEDLIIEYGLVGYTYIWSSSFEHFWDSLGDLKNKFTLEMARSPNGNSNEKTIKIIMSDCTPAFTNLGYLKKIEGYLDIEDLIMKYGLGEDTYVWSSAFKHFWNSFGCLEHKLILEMGSFSYENNNEKTIKVVTNDGVPVFQNLSYQIMGLAIINQTSDKWRGNKYCIYDYEDSTFEISCSNIQFSKGTQEVEFEE